MITAPKGFTPHPYPYHHTLELEIESLTNLGLGLGRDQGWVIQVPYALPGEKIRARIYRNNKNYSSADCISVLQPSPHRVSLDVLCLENVEGANTSILIINLSWNGSVAGTRFFCTNSRY